MRTRWDERGQALALAAVMMPLFVAIVGLALDGALVFNARRVLQDAADGAARAGAMQIDQRAYRESFGERVVLDPASAREVAAAYLADGPAGLSAEVAADPERVVVRVSRDVPTAFLRIVRIDSVRIGAVAPAELRYGVEQANR
jgi:Flp pilus assembly protein TadG